MNKIYLVKIKKERRAGGKRNENIKKARSRVNIKGNRGYKVPEAGASQEMKGPRSILLSLIDDHNLLITKCLEPPT